VEEYFDVVDIYDEVLRKAPRSEVHREKSLHRAVHVFLFRPGGQMLIHRRTQTKEEFPGVWTSSCSGHVSAGETYDETAPRELWEELKVAAKSLQRLQKFSACESTSWEFTTLYRITTTVDPEPDEAEIAEIRWMALPDIYAWMTAEPDQFSPAFLILFRWYCEHQSSLPSMSPG
jgi:16S rRNA (adenine1518-N6/adenine1519-N6)-dimethyltransferase